MIYLVILNKLFLCVLRALVSFIKQQFMSNYIFPSHILRGHNSTGDLKLLDSSLPLSLSSSSLPGDPEQQGFRRRASTFSHSPTPSSMLEDSPLYMQTHPLQEQSAATKPKLVRHYSVSTDTPHQSK